MTGTRNIQSTLNWLLPFINYLPATVGGQEPALSSANIVIQTILGPPFCWRWNRATTSFTCTQTGQIWNQDYTKSLTDFGFLEKAWITNAAGLDLKELTVKQNIAVTKEDGRAFHVAAINDDGSNNITFRLDKVPTEAFVVTLQYQKKPPTLLSIAQGWPLPDELAYIYDWGLLGIISILANDPRFPIFNQRFTSHLLGAQQGLEETERNIFLGNFLEVMRQVQSTQQRTGQGIAARQQ